MFKTVKMVYFSHIFKFAETEYGIGWNTANDVFFKYVFGFGEVTKFDSKSWADTIVHDKIKQYSNRNDFENWPAVNELLTKDEVLSLTTRDIGHVITAHFLHTHNLFEVVEIDSR